MNIGGLTRDDTDINLLNDKEILSLNLNNEGTQDNQSKIVPISYIN
jgi:hypothetical protein